MRKVNVISVKRVFEGFFAVDEVKVSYQKPDGTMSNPTQRDCVERGDAVAVLVLEKKSDQFLLVQQFRYPTMGHGEPWIVEVVAGKIDGGETPSDAALRETHEEIGAKPKNLKQIAQFYSSPGGMSEMITVFFTEVEIDNLASTGGLEDEDLEIIRVPRAEAYENLVNGVYHDSKTIVALEWFFRTNGKPQA